MITLTRTRPLPRRALYAAVLLGLLAPALAIAQEDPFSLEEPEAPVDPDVTADLTEVRSFVEFGVGYVDDDSFRFGRYSGLEEEGAYGVLNFDWYRRAAYDSPDPTFTRFTGENLGLSSRRAHLEHGRQGDYRVRFDYAQLPMFRSDSASTIFEGAGGTRLTLPAGWVGAPSTAGMTQLLPSLGPVDIRHERRRIGLGLDKLLSASWDISTSVRQETKEGLKTIGAVIGNSGGNPRAVLLPEPIDYETREADVALRYSGLRQQLEFRYLVSLFDDGNRALAWQNPFTAINGWEPSAGYPTGFGQLALPPDNQFHQASVAGGYSWDSGLRFTADLAYGRMTQDEAFLPYTINPDLAASIVQPLPRTSLDGRIDTTVANVRLGGRPSERFHWNASLRFDDRDNRTPRNEYVYIGGDSNLQDVDVDSSRRRFNEPYSYRDTRLKLDGGYRFGKRTRLTGAVERRETERTFSEREDADETTASLHLRHAASDWFSGALRLVRADRSGSTYHGEEPFLSSYAPGYTSTVPSGWENPPGLRKYHLADRVRDRIGATATLTPDERWSIGFDVQQVEDDYDRSELGLTRSDSDVYTIDVSFMPADTWSNYLFYTREEMALDQDGHSLGANPLVDIADPARAWNARHRDQVDTAGVGFKWNAIEKRLVFGADYVYARTRNEVTVTTGSALTSAPLPPNLTRLTSVSLFGRYRLRNDLSLQMRFWNERYRSTDFALDGVAANQLANVILLGEESPDYNVNAVTVSLTYQF